MGKLVYAANTSLDGYVEDEDGAFDWSVPDEEVHAFWNEHERGIGTSLYGRRMYETMRVWEDDDWLADEPAVVREYAQVWRDSDKVVFSSTLDTVTTARTRVERTFDPEAVRRLKAGSERDLSVGGATLGAAAFRHGLVDETVPVCSGSLFAAGAAVGTTRQVVLAGAASLADEVEVVGSHGVTVAALPHGSGLVLKSFSGVACP